MYIKRKTNRTKKKMRTGDFRVGAMYYYCYYNRRTLAVKVNLVNVKKEKIPVTI